MPSAANRILSIPSSATVEIADTVTSMRLSGQEVFDFSAGRAFENTPAYICDAAIEAIQAGDTHQTPARGKPSYLEACARKLERENNLNLDPSTHLIATMGCKQGLLLALLAILDEGDEILVEDPGFVSYHPTIRFCGAKAVPVPLIRENGFKWKAGELNSRITDRTRAILFCSPHNPTGVVHSEEDLKAIADVAIQHDLYVIADEIYERVTWNGRPHISIASLPGMEERTIGLMGVTKSFAMGGWRVGFAYAADSVIDGMVVSQQHLMTCAGSFAQTGATKAVKEAPPPSIIDLWKEWEFRCRHVTERINEIPRLSANAPEGGFYAWIDISTTNMTSLALADYLLTSHQVALVPGSAFGSAGEGYLRMTCVKSRVELEQGLDRIANAIAHLDAETA